MRLIATATLALVLTGCAVPREDAVLAEGAVMAEPTVVQAAPKSKINECVPGEDDGIGGTGCSTD